MFSCVVDITGKVCVVLFLMIYISCQSKEQEKSIHPINFNCGDTTLPYDVNDYFITLADSAINLTKQSVIYDPSYFSIDYPNGEIPNNKGVCADVIIRAYRKLHFDLQKAVHEDMLINFEQYPHKWGLKKTDKNIDHRRVPNLMTFFERHEASLPITQNYTDYHYGDIVCWSLSGGLTHIGMVVNRKSTDQARPLIVHNIGGGQVLADCLFDYTIIGHYRFNHNTMNKLPISR